MPRTAEFPNGGPYDDKNRKYQGWLKNQSSRLALLREEESRFQIIQTHDFDEDERVGKYSFSTTEEGRWELTVNRPQGLSLPAPVIGPQSLDILFQDLAMQQKLSPPRDDAERNHARGMRLFSRNWIILSQLLNPRQRGEIEPHPFIEVSLGKHGQADLVGIDRSGTVLILEFGRGETKAGQVKKYIEGVGQLLHSLNGQSLTRLPIMGFVVNYAYSEVNNLTLHPVENALQ